MSIMLPGATHSEQLLMGVRQKSRRQRAPLYGCLVFLCFSYGVGTLYQFHGTAVAPVAGSSPYINPEAANDPNRVPKQTTGGPTKRRSIAIQEFKDEISRKMVIAKRTDEKCRPVYSQVSTKSVQDCLDWKQPTSLIYPQDAHQHFLKIHLQLAEYAQHEGHRPHEWANFSGPWVENAFITRMTSLYETSACLSELYGPYIPLLIPWTDHFVDQGFFGYPPTLWNRLATWLRPNVPYVAVVQNDEGLFARLDKYNHSVMPNVLVLSAGGYGHVPIPLLQREQSLTFPRIPVSQRRHFVSYVGSDRHAPRDLRKQMIRKLQKRYFNDNSSFLYYRGPEWKSIMSQSKVSLCPRGFGRTSFHFMETLQMGLVPIQVYSDVAWVPYRRFLEVQNISFACSFKKLSALLVSLQGMDASWWEDREDSIQALRPTHFTLQGVLHQIQAFLQGENSDLECQRLPRSVRDA